ncbi:unnamed protein product [Bemisia tabaci]|uniref:CCHC-type domain-containing protein n=1 Tax=Bemisia tabaci TaxID=7038 RepID=A0AAI8Y5V0_BEMTA|nr:unnamed protein product [Bemisia tabaci]
MKILQNRKGINIQGTSNDKETIKQMWAIALKNLTQSEEIKTTSKNQSEVMRASGLRNDVCDEQIYNLIADNLKDQNVTIDIVKQRAHIFRKATYYTDKNRMMVYLRVETPLLEKMTTQCEFYSSSGSWGTIRIVPIIYVSQCPKCFQYGHGPLKCEKDNICRRCGSNEHLSRECKQSNKFCFICKEAKNGQEKNHTCTDKECPIRQLEY